ncbi:MAG: hypothetical protein UY48_C0008G0006 [Candidatus Gottesmanbacteria bacterium GW2011_GWB1_49_7]|uniref:Uncharacterized protein n=1 Tax=Candidatus Gottesmanbacteria bacterium GW2011_GWB1_49_7 TaxID=1618448 RepID=A0A0G1W257_9BACT|nr:MAG: hypothetical protein UY48_C0008G0006 [Candidatus Gottesmanbacteria bacterium GW2011_GWB1_49_7]
MSIYLVELEKPVRLGREDLHREIANALYVQQLVQEYISLLEEELEYLNERPEEDDSIRHDNEGVRRNS